MTEVGGTSTRTPKARVLVLSMFLAPCREVGGKRFSFLSKYMAERFAEYHVLARKEPYEVSDQSAFRGNVHRTRSLPYFPPTSNKGMSVKLGRLWAKWLCQVDPYIGWVLPAAVKGIGLVKKHRLNVVVVTAPAFSSIIAAMLITRMTGARLLLDYRDEWTNHVQRYRRPFGRFICPRIEKSAIKRASAVVFCSDVMRREFDDAFGTLAPATRQVIYNGFESPQIDATESASGSSARTRMIFAGNFYGNRQLSIVGPALSQLLSGGEISPETFRLHIYSRLSEEQINNIAEQGITELVEVHKPVSYDRIQQILRESDIQFLPSGNEVNYAIPFKFFDYLAAARPILAVASRQSAVYELMQSVDCGEFAEIDNNEQIFAAMRRLLSKEVSYSFEGAERFMWKYSAERYADLITQLAA